MRGIDHVGIVVDDLDEAKRFLADVLGLTLARELEVAELKVRVAFFTCGPTEIEVIEATDDEERARRLGDSTARIEHIAIRVDDLGATARSLERHGVTFRARGAGDEAEPIAVNGRLNLWTEPDSCDGVQYQLLQEEAQ